MRFRYLPSADVSATGSQLLNARLGIKTNIWTTLFGYYLGINLLITPAILAYIEQYFAAAILFAIAVGASLLFNWKGNKKALAHFFSQIHCSDPDWIQLEFAGEAIRSTCRDCSAVYPWASIVHVEDNGSDVFLFLKDCVIPIPRSAFGSDEERKALVEYSRACIDGSRQLSFGDDNR